MESMIADEPSKGIGVLRLALIAFALALPAAAHSLEGTAYLPVREGTPAKGATPEETPSDTETPIDWRRGVLGTEATDRSDSSPQ